MIELLVDRLRWPAALVRERAASRLGKLIRDGNQEARDHLIAWISRQELESLAAIGLLPFLHADARGGISRSTADELFSACRARSVLSELYLNHLDPSYACRPEIGRHSGADQLKDGSHPVIQRKLQIRQLSEVYEKSYGELKAIF